MDMLTTTLLGLIIVAIGTGVHFYRAVRKQHEYQQKPSPRRVNDPRVMDFTLARKAAGRRVDDARTLPVQRRVIETPPIRDS